MNLILFKETENLTYLDSKDERYKHIKNVIKPGVGDSLDCGIINGKQGKMKIDSINDSKITFTVSLNKEPKELLPITYIIGTPRPPVAKRLLKDLTTTGIGKIIMCSTDLGEKTYLTSNLWKDEKYMEYIIDGCQQGESTRLPELERYFSLKKALDSLPNNINRLAMDNISPDLNISNFIPEHSETVIAIGGERGFSDRERVMLREYKFKIFKLGDRVLRTETACHYSLGAILAKLALI